MFRKLSACVMLFGFAALFLLAHRAEPAAAQGQKVNAAEKQILALRAEVAELKAANAALQAANNSLQSTNATLQTAAAKKTTDKTDPKSKSTTTTPSQFTLDGYRNAGLVHFVVLKLKSDSPQTEVQAVIDDTNKELSKIKTVRGVWAGKPSDSGTPDVAATDYTLALAFVFDDAAGLKKYLDDPIHTKFADKHLKLWETPVVYDFEPKK